MRVNQEKKALTFGEFIMTIKVGFAVTLTLTTHDEGGIAEKDFTVARQCDEVFSKFLVS